MSPSMHSNARPELRAWRGTALPRALAGMLLLAASLPSLAAAEDHLEDQWDSILDSIQVFGTVELSYERQQNFDLDNAEADDLDVLPLELELEILFEPSDYFSAYARSQLKYEVPLHEKGGRDAESTALLINEANVTVSEPDPGFSLRLGRQLFEDERQWLYDTELDAVRGTYENPNLLVELSASRRSWLFQEDLLNPDDVDKVNYYQLYAIHEPAEDIAVGAYALVLDERDGNDNRAVFFGLTSTGSPFDGLTYWLEAALLRGEDEEGRSLRGYGFDLIGSYRFDAALSPRILAGYAFGSGDSDPDDDRNGQFRQTGIQDNEAELDSIASFHYYGEAFDPELSNMSIVTLGAGIRPRVDLSIDLIAHAYFQDVAADELQDSAFDAEPTGRSRRLGSEIDLVLGYKPRKKFQVNGFLGYFTPGRAFEDGADTALFARIEFEIGL